MYIILIYIIYLLFMIKEMQFIDKLVCLLVIKCALFCLKAVRRNYYVFREHRIYRNIN